MSDISCLQLIGISGRTPLGTPRMTSLPVNVGYGVMPMNNNNYNVDNSRDQFADIKNLNLKLALPSVANSHKTMPNANTSDSTEYEWNCSASGDIHLTGIAGRFLISQLLLLLRVFEIA
jgi:hypothetical protein